MVELLWLIPALPLAGFVVLLLFGKRIGEPLAGWLGTAMVGAVVPRRPRRLRRALERARAHLRALAASRWIPAGDFSVDIGFLLDPLSMTMVLFITGIAALIHLYSIGYMHGDSRFPRFFTYLNLFVFSMLMLVLGDNLRPHLPRLGGRGRLLVLPHLVLVREGRQRQRRQEGLHHQPRR